MAGEHSNFFSNFRAQVGSYLTEARLKAGIRRWPWMLKLRAHFSRQFENTFFYLTFSILGKLAASDGRIDDLEKGSFELFMRDELQLDSRQKVLAYSILRNARTLPITVEELARQYYLRYRKSRRMLEHLIGVLLDVASADTHFSHAETEILRSIIKIFGISREEYQRIKQTHEELFRMRRMQHARFQDTGGPRHSESFTRPEPSPSQRAFTILGLKGNEDLAAIKKAYRVLALKFHPDRLSANGLPAEFLKRASEKFREIQAAYELLEKERA